VGLETLDQLSNIKGPVAPTFSLRVPWCPIERKFKKGAWSTDTTSWWEEPKPTGTVMVSALPRPCWILKEPNYFSDSSSAGYSVDTGTT
jgi:hypothetical protein